MSARPSDIGDILDDAERREYEAEPRKGGGDSMTKLFIHRDGHAPFVLTFASLGEALDEWARRAPRPGPNGPVDSRDIVGVEDVAAVAATTGRYPVRRRGVVVAWDPRPGEWEVE